MDGVPVMRYDPVGSQLVSEVQFVQQSPNSNIILYVTNTVASEIKSTDTNLWDQSSYNCIAVTNWLYQNTGSILYVYSRTDLWNRASTDSISATNGVFVLNAQTQTWYTVNQKVSTNDAKYLAALTNNQSGVNFGSLTVGGNTVLTNEALWLASIAYNITSGNTNNWSVAYSWVNSNSNLFSSVLSSTSNWNYAYNWGNHATNGYAFVSVTNGLLPVAGTNGFVTASITNGLLPATGTNGFVTASVTNGLAAYTVITNVCSNAVLVAGANVTITAATNGNAVTYTVASSGGGGGGGGSCSDLFLATKGGTSQGPFSDNVATKVTFTSEVSDVNGWYEPTNSTLTVKQNGTYVFVGGVGANSGSGASGGYLLYVNGTRRHDMFVQGYNYPGVNRYSDMAVFPPINLSSNDAVTLYITLYNGYSSSYVAGDTNSTFFGAWKLP
jgi:hypothetical protein